jgi:hypothetical protein
MTTNANLTLETGEKVQSGSNLWLIVGVIAVIIAAVVGGMRVMAYGCFSESKPCFRNMNKIEPKKGSKYMQEEVVNTERPML